MSGSKQKSRSASLRSVVAGSLVVLVLVSTPAVDAHARPHGDGRNVVAETRSEKTAGGERFLQPKSEHDGDTNAKQDSSTAADNGSGGDEKVKDSGLKQIAHDGASANEPNDGSRTSVTDSAQGEVEGGHNEEDAAGRISHDSEKEADEQEHKQTDGESEHAEEGPATNKVKEHLPEKSQKRVDANESDEEENAKPFFAIIRLPLSPPHLFIPRMRWPSVRLLLPAAKRNHAGSMVSVKGRQTRLEPRHMEMLADHLHSLYDKLQNHMLKGQRSDFVVQQDHVKMLEELSWLIHQARKFAAILKGANAELES
ncbi:hypothetical protein BESB_003170 [Besnoitia besnoiti]|uniref:Transmembrane protein n=1 Tax=Besnoitia besnoiti TaxID=94643 RepID=A0A2A9MNW8_BESBE|nr:hypothetical protein BESB_003170 [Besnoitia besnoiti]PFH37976.1 hypothetical protein BESB_003170 [Besnoitia besnoiti]